MYLLIHVRGQITINPKDTLHPTMYLLIPGAAGIADIADSTLHPTMYLLILEEFCHYILEPACFTSHYVSINSICTG